MDSNKGLALKKGDQEPWIPETVWSHLVSGFLDEGSSYLRRLIGRKKYQNFECEPLKQTYLPS